MMRSRVDLLLVEDNPADAELFLMALSEANAGARARVAFDGVDALDYLFRRGEYAQRPDFGLPAVVLLDIMMPRMSGLEVLRQLRANPETRLMPIVMFTSSSAERDVLEAYEFGVNSYVQKPVDFDRLREVLATISNYWLGLNELRPARSVATPAL